MTEDSDVSAGQATNPVKKPRRIRLSHDVRREMLIEKAVEFFYEHGLQAQIRDFSASLGVSEGLIFHYFGTKQALMDQVYSRVYNRSWSDAWLEDLQDRGLPLRERIENFYVAYLASVDREEWIRGSFYASLTTPNYSQLYFHQHMTDVLNVMLQEIGTYIGLPPDQADEMDKELVWHLHSSIIYYLIRKHMLKLEVAKDKRAFIRRIVDNVFCELDQVRQAKAPVATS